MFSIAEYQLALSQGLSATDVKMLQLNYDSHNRTITSAQMTLLMGWKGSSAGSLHYGKLGERVAKALQHTIQPHKNGKIYKTSILVHFSKKSRFIEWTLWDNLATALENLKLVQKNHVFLHEILVEEFFIEGSLHKIIVNKFERDPKARAECIRKHGTSCEICGFNFYKNFGEKMEGFIHVHHLNPLSEIREEYIIDPIKDLRPVCPNCHAVIHSKRPAYSIEEVRAMLKRGSL